MLVGSWSLKGIMTRVVFSVVVLDRKEDWSETLEFKLVLTVEPTRRWGYFSLENTSFSHSHS